VGIYEFLLNYAGSSDKIIDAQELYCKVKYEKSENEMRLIAQAASICDIMLEDMLAV